VRRAIRAAAVRLPELFARGTRLLVGFSGGQDSTCLLHALANAHRGLDLVAIHVDHALRPDSAAAAQRAACLAASLGVPCEIVRVDVAAYRWRLAGRSVENAARAARYHAFASARERHRAEAVAVAHTADDQAETLLLHLARGSGLSGLASMRMDQTIDAGQLGPPVPELGGADTSVRVARPLLKVARAATLAYCAQFELPVVEDPSNLNRAFARNRVRLDVLPVLEQLNPSIRTVLARLAELAAEDDQVLDRLATGHLADVAENGGYHLARWRAQPRAIQRRMLRRIFARLAGGLDNLRHAPIEDTLDFVQTAGPNRTYHLPNGVEVRVERTIFFVTQA
jgi:tRNA(Ile)-lysidine synthetase-like protein